MKPQDHPEETMPREELEQLQLERLQATLNRVRRHVEFYRNLLARSGIDPSDVRSLDDLRRIPFTTRRTLIEGYPYALFTVPLREVVRLQSTPTETGHPIVVGYTRNDLDNWSALAARVLEFAGVGREDVVQIMFDYDLFGGGLGLHFGAERIGASVVPGSGLPAGQQLAVMRDYRTTVAVAPPSMLLRLAEALRAGGLSPEDLSLRIGIVGGEPRDELSRHEIEAQLMISVFEHYGTPEVMGSAVGAECQQKRGLHLFEDHVLAEIVDPETDETVPPGGAGELVLTTLAKEAFPLVRYRTGDIVRLAEGPCPCGRTFARISPPLGRTDDRLVVDGVTFFPRQVHEIVRRTTNEPLGSRIVLTREGARDRAALDVEITADVFEDEVRKLFDIKDRLETALRQDLGLNFEVRLVPPSALEPAHRRLTGVDDRRA